MDAMMDRILTVPEVATYLQMSKSKVYYLIQRKEVPHIKIGRNVRIRQSDLEKWLTKQSIEELTTNPMDNEHQSGRRITSQIQPNPANSIRIK
jgi:excisionase family DNA binding protein